MTSPQPTRAAQSDGGTAPADLTPKVYTPTTPLGKVSSTTLPTEGVSASGSCNRSLRPRLKNINYSEQDSNVLELGCKMHQGKFKCESPKGLLRGRKPWGAIKKMLGRKDHTLQRVQQKMGLLQIKAKYADTVSSHKLINERLDKIDKCHLPLPTEL